MGLSEPLDGAQVIHSQGGGCPLSVLTAASGSLTSVPSAPLGEKPYTCPHCSRAFADRSNLRAHLQTHSDTKKYRCKRCAKTFSRMALLARHEEAGCCTP